MFMADAEKLAAAGADFFVCPDNTAHIALESPGEPFPDPVPAHRRGGRRRRRVRDGRRKVGILGTEIYHDRPGLSGRARPPRARLGGAVEDDRELVNEIIFDELCLGVFTDEFARCLCPDHRAGWPEQGCDSVALVCTEIPLLITAEDVAAADARFDPAAGPRGGRGRDRRAADAGVARRADQLKPGAGTIELAELALGDRRIAGSVR